MQAATGAEVYIHEADAPMLSDSNLNLEKWITGETETTPISEYHAIHDGDTIVQDECVFHVLHTPGHTKGGVCYQLDRTLFTGDTLFRCSRGRTDFPGGSDAELYASLQRLKQLEGDYDVLPGHNETSTLSFEREHNLHGFSACCGIRENTAAVQQSCRSAHRKKTNRSVNISSAGCCSRCCRI